uniref:Major facilitator superfamily (MFS) profile domain-containing protein n=1 Tax=Amblyomma maculatum TaxID=34609 RepID=G3MTI2_AMBMU
MANVPVLGILLDKPPWEKAALAEAKKPSTGPNSMADNENESIYHGSGDPDLLPTKRRSTAFGITNHRRTTQASLYPVLEVSETVAASHLANNRNSVFKGETPAPHHRSSIASRRNRVDSTVSAKTLSDASSIASAIPPKISGMERRGTMMSVAGSIFAARRFSTCEGDASSRRGTILGECLQPSHCPEDAQQANVQNTTGDAPTSALSSLKQVLSEPRMYLYTLSFFSCTIFVDSFLTVMFDLGEDIGVPISDSVLALTLSSAVEVVGRFFVPFLTDYGLASTISLLTFSYLMLAVISALMPLVSDKIAFVAICATLGLPAGYISVGSSEILSTDMGTKNLPMAYGILLLACAIGGFVRPPVVGFFRDKLGSYNGLFQMLGGMLLLSFIFNVGLWIAGSCSRTRGSKTTSVQDGGNVPISEALSTLGNTEQSTSL